MPVTRKQKGKGRKSRQADIMSVSEHFIVMITSSHFERGQSDLDDLIARPDNQCCGNSVEPNSHGNTNSKDNEIRGFSANGLSDCKLIQMLI